MRLIPWNQEVFDNAYAHFKYYKGQETPPAKRIGFAAEALVQDYYGLIHNYEMPEGDDGGYDMILNGAKIDIKCDMCKYDYFANRSSLFFVKNYGYDFRSDFYLFVKIDIEAKKIALIGYLTPPEIKMKGEYYKYGDYIFRFHKNANASGYLVSQADINVIHAFSD